MNRRDFLKNSILGSIILPQPIKAAFSKNSAMIGYQVYYELGKISEYGNHVLWSDETPRLTSEYGYKTYYGKLNEKLFDDINKKIYYLKGVFDGYYGHTLDKGYLEFIREEEKFNRCIKWLNEITDYSNTRTPMSPAYKTEYHRQFIYIDKNLIDFIKKI